MIGLSAIGRFLDDRANPIVVKELRQLVRSRFVSGMLIVFLVGALVLVFFRVVADPDIATDAAGGQEITMALYVGLMVSCLLFVPLYTGNRMASERSGDNVDLMYITTLSGAAVIRGKMLAAAVLTLMIFSACMPFMTFTYLLRGVDLPTVFFVLVVGFIAVMAATQFLLMLACLPGGRAARLMLGLAGLFVLAMVISGLFKIAEEVFRYGMPFDEAEFWAGFGTVAFGVVLAMGLMFVFSVALITPPSANRSLPVRSYLTAVWAVTGIVAWAWAVHEAEPEIVFGWSVGAVLVMTCLLPFAVSERTSWGPRVRRRIPRNPVLRLAAFLLYTGAAGGVFWCVILAGISLVIAAATTASLSAGDPDKTIQFRVTALMLLYGYCYAMTAVLVQRWILRKAVPAKYNWLTFILLMLAGGLLPGIFELLITMGQPVRKPLSNFWAITSPAAVIDTSAPRLVEAALAFTGLWGLLAFFLSIPWMARQVEAFKPLPQGQGSDATAATDAPSSELPSPAAARPEPVPNDDFPTAGPSS